MADERRVHCSLIQGDFGSGGHGNLEAVIRFGDTLRHYYRDNEDGNSWKAGQTIVASGVAGPGCIIQSDFASDGHGNFEVVVPIRNAAGGMDLRHFFHDNSNVALPWQAGQLIASGVAGAGCIIQSDFASDGHGNFEVVVPIVNGNGGMDLRHFFHDNSNVALPWQAGQLIASGVAGAGCIIQSDFASDGHGNFEVVVPVPGSEGGTDLRHFFHDNSNVALPWQAGQVIASGVAGPGCIIQSDFASGDHGNFEVVVALPYGDALQLRHFFHDNSDVGLPWQRGQFVTDCASGGAALIRSNYGPRDHGNFEVLVQERTTSVVAYFHDNTDVRFPWMRDRPVVFEPMAFIGDATHRICQLTGQWDRTGWSGVGTAPLAFNTTETSYGIRGTDLGSSFEHRGKTYFLFGDTARVVPPAADGLDSIAWTDSRNAAAGLPLTFLPSWPAIAPPVGQGGFEVPLDGVSAGNSMYVFFSTDAYQAGGKEVMGRSVLTRCDDDGIHFQQLRTFSSYRFVNVSIQRGRLDERAAVGLGWERELDVLWIWGSGRYRSSEVYLAVVPFAQLGSTGRFDVRFFSGSASDPRWSGSEEDATPVILNGAVGEMSVRWNAPLRRYLATFNSDNPRGILLHSARQPWGPWTPTPSRCSTRSACRIRTTRARPPATEPSCTWPGTCAGATTCRTTCSAVSATTSGAASMGRTRSAICRPRPTAAASSTT